MRSDRPPAVRLALGAALSFALAGCAHEMVENAAKTVEEGQRATANDPQQQIVRVSAERATAGIVGELSDPEERAKMRQLISELVNQAVTSALRTAMAKPPAEAMAGGDAESLTSPMEDLMANAARAAVEASLRSVLDGLGEHGEGPLADSLAATGRKVSTAVAGAAVGTAFSTATDELRRSFPDCTGPDALGCIDRQIRQLSHSAGAGFTRGVWDSIGWAVVALAALVGLAVGLLAAWLWSLRTVRLLRTRTT